MRSMQAVYWPIWKIDLLFEGSADARNKGRTGSSSAFLSVNDAFIPGEQIDWDETESLADLIGSPLAPLSYISYEPHPLEDDLLTYIPKDHLKRLGEGFNITAVPFSVSPFAVIKTNRKMVGKKGLLDEVTFDEQVEGDYSEFHIFFITILRLLTFSVRRLSDLFPNLRGRVRAKTQR